MASTYSSFLQSPSAGLLASDASLNYITTTTTISEPNAILKHIQSQAKQVTKKEEKVLNAIEGAGSLFLETETTLEFNNGGGAYLPGMDDNLLDEKLVTFPLLHVVSFDSEQKIKQIRLHWDQGTLLKQVEAIGRTGRNWPIKDGQAQIVAITKSLKASGIEPNKQSIAPLAHRNGPDVAISGQHRQQRDSVSAMRDPHASLALFAPRDPNADPAGPYDGPTTAPRASAKPAPRNYNELFASGDSPGGPASKIRSPSPTKADGVILKAGAGKHYQGNRLFDENPEDNNLRSPERKKTYGQKYDHFAFGDGEDARPTSEGRTSKGSKGSKGATTFSFEDFNTPPKHQIKARPDDVRHWGAEDEPPPSPPKRPVVHAARKDADTHFQLADENAPPNPRTHQRQASSKSSGLYDDHVTGNDERPADKDNTVHVENSRRGNDFGAHYAMTDSGDHVDNAAPDKHTTRGDMSQHWTHGTPPTEKKIYKTAGDGMGGRKAGQGFSIGQEPEAQTGKKIYKTAGDGMGGRSAARSWGIGDDSDPEVQAANVRSSARGRRGNAQAGAANDF